MHLLGIPSLPQSVGLNRNLSYTQIDGSHPRARNQVRSSSFTSEIDCSAIRLPSDSLGNWPHFTSKDCDDEWISRVWRWFLLRKTPKQQKHFQRPSPLKTLRSKENVTRYLSMYPDNFFHRSSSNCTGTRMVFGLILLLGRL